MLEIAERNGKMDLLPFKDLEAAKKAYNFQNLQSFLDIYYAGCAVLLHEKVLCLFQSHSPSLYSETSSYVQDISMTAFRSPICRLFNGIRKT